MALNPERKRLGKQTLAWIGSHPQLIGHLERLQEVSEDPHSELETLEAAERRSSSCPAKTTQLSGAWWSPEKPLFVITPVVNPGPQDDFRIEA